MKKNTNPYILLFSVWGLLAIISAFIDLPVMQKYANPQSGWAHFMEAYGQIPGVMIGFFGVSVLLRLNKFEKNFKSIASGVGLGILTIITSFMLWGEALGQQVGADVNYILAFVLGILLLVIVQAWFRRVPDGTMQEYRTFGQIAITLMFVAGLVTVWGIKIPWGRWTYRDMLEIGDLSLFTPWYLPQGINGHHSFISGHTALSFCVLPVVLLFRKNNKRYSIAWLLVITWGVVGALSRVAIGAHFPSDVLFGGGQTILWFLILLRKLDRVEPDPSTVVNQNAT